MKTDNDSAIRTVKVREKVRVTLLTEELREAIAAAQSAGKFDQLRLCYETRRTLWADQTEDGRHGDPRKSAGDRFGAMPSATKRSVFRWEGAPDLRVPLADEMVRRLTMLRKVVLTRGDIRVAPRLVAGGSSEGTDGQTELRRADVAAIWQTVLEHFQHAENWRMSYAWGLFNTCVEEYGYAGLQPDWMKVRRMELRKVSLQELADWLMNRERQEALVEAQRNAAAAGMALEEEVLPPEIEAALAARVAMRLEELVTLPEEMSAEAIELVRGYDPAMSAREARHVLAQLRARGNEPALYQAPVDEGGRPVTKVLIPWINWIHPHDLTGDGETSWTAMPEYLDATQLAERAAAERWNQASTTWLKETQENKLFANLYSDLSLPGWAMNGVGVNLVPCEEALKTSPRWLVITMWRRVTDEDGLPRVVKVVFHPAMTEDQEPLLWEETDCSELPLLVATSEEVAYAMQARGVPEVIVDKQNFVKDALDGEGARGQLGSNPPLLRTAKDHVGVRPGIELYARRQGNSFEGSQFMEVPNVDSGTLNLVDRVTAMVRRYFFCDTTTDPESKQMFEEERMTAAVTVLNRWIRMLWKLIQENVDELQVGRIAGRAVRLEVNRDQLQGEADVDIGFYAGSFKEGAAEKLVDVLTKAVQLDRGGTLDSNEAMKLVVTLLSPTYARRLARSADEALQRNREDERQRLAQIMAGVPVNYEAQVPGVNDRMAEVQAFLANPYNVQQLELRPDLREAMEREVQYLQFHRQQQEVNPVIGRTGVEPPRQPGLEEMMGR